jgi:hypothetical protein
VDNGIARRERRSDLGTRERQGEVERGDTGDHSQRLAPAQDANRGLVALAITAIHLHREASEEAEEPGTMRHDGFAKVAIRHAHIHRFANCEIFGATIKQIGHAKQDFRHRRPVGSGAPTSIDE